MVDEFIYQFQSFCQYRAKLTQRTDQELAFLRQFDKVWNVAGVLNYLQALIEKSMILQILDKEKNANSLSLPLMVMIIMVEQMCSKVLGYFSIAGLLHVHCLLGDYQSGLCALSPIDINHPGVFNTVIGCQITTIHYYGFANLML
jgi:translation initiation factor 3 subunit L